MSLLWLLVWRTPLAGCFSVLKTEISGWVTISVLWFTYLVTVGYWADVIRCASWMTWTQASDGKKGLCVMTVNWCWLKSVGHPGKTWIQISAQPRSSLGGSQPISVALTIQYMCRQHAERSCLFLCSFPVTVTGRDQPIDQWLSMFFMSWCADSLWSLPLMMLLQSSTRFFCILGLCFYCL